MVLHTPPYSLLKKVLKDGSVLINHPGPPWERISDKGVVLEGPPIYPSYPVRQGAHTSEPF